MNVALKEWAAVVEAIGRGRQIFLLRKGGIVEAKRGFELRHQEFLFFPTFEHQQLRFLKPEYQEWLGPATDALRIRYLGRVAEVTAAPASPEEFPADAHIWTEEFLRQRYEYRPDLPLHLVLVRVYSLAEEHVLPIRASYAGCKSWVNLTEEISAEGAVPVLSDEEFAGARQAMPRVARAPQPR